MPAAMMPAANMGPRRKAMFFCIESLPLVDLFSELEAQRFGCMPTDRQRARIAARLGGELGQSITRLRCMAWGTRENQQTVDLHSAHLTHLPRSQAIHSRFTNMARWAGVGDFTPMGSA